MRLKKQGQHEIRVLVSTDVLSEGLNLQDASRMINYDIHWNPVRLMQRIGRVDRRMNPEIEKRILAHHCTGSDFARQGQVLEFPTARRTQRHPHALYEGHPEDSSHLEDPRIEGKKLLTPEDDFDALRDFNHAYEGTRTAIEEMHLEYQALLQC